MGRVGIISKDSDYSKNMFSEMPMHIYCWVRNVGKGKNKGLENSAFECCQ